MRRKLRNELVVVIKNPHKKNFVSKTPLKGVKRVVLVYNSQYTNDPNTTQIASGAGRSSAAGSNAAIESPGTHQQQSAGAGGKAINKGLGKKRLKHRFKDDFKQDGEDGFKKGRRHGRKKIAVKHFRVKKRRGHKHGHGHGFGHDHGHKHGHGYGHDHGHKHRHGHGHGHGHKHDHGHGHDHRHDGHGHGHGHGRKHRRHGCKCGLLTKFRGCKCGAISKRRRWKGSFDPHKEVVIVVNDQIAELPKGHENAAATQIASGGGYDSTAGTNSAIDSARTEQQQAVGGGEDSLGKNIMEHEKKNRKFD